VSDTCTQTNNKKVHTGSLLHALQIVSLWTGQQHIDFERRFM